MDKLEDLLEFCERIGLDLDNVRHIILSNGWELFAEIQDFEMKTLDDDGDDSTEIVMEFSFAGEGQIIANYPLRVIRDSMIENGQYHSQSVFINYNAYSSNTTVPINTIQIVSIDEPDMEAKVEYAINLYEEYHKEDEPTAETPKRVISTKSTVVDPNNVVQFSDYRK